MSLAGTVNRAAMLLAMVLITAGWVWNQFYSGGPEAVMPYIGVGGIGGFIAAMVVIFWKHSSPYMAPVYALLEGLVIGAISALAERRYPGIAIQATGLTFGIMAAMLVLYRTGILRNSPKFSKAVFAATLGIALLYLLDLMLSLFGMPISFINAATPIGILFSLFVIVIAAANFIIDLDMIEQGVAAGAPKYMEWYGAFGLMVTLIWLYMEVLRMLGKMRSR